MFRCNFDGDAELNDPDGDADADTGVRAGTDFDTGRADDDCKDAFGDCEVCVEWEGRGEGEGDDEDEGEAALAVCLSTERCCCPCILCCEFWRTGEVW